MCQVWLLYAVYGIMPNYGPQLSIENIQQEIRELRIFKALSRVCSVYVQYHLSNHIGSCMYRYVYDT